MGFITFTVVVAVGAAPILHSLGLDVVATFVRVGKQPDLIPTRPLHDFSREITARQMYLASCEFATP